MRKHQKVAAIPAKDRSVIIVDPNVGVVVMMPAADGAQLEPCTYETEATWILSKDESIEGAEIQVKVGKHVVHIARLYAYGYRDDVTVERSAWLDACHQSICNDVRRQGVK